MAKRPNILLFMPDQLRADSIGCFGNPVVQRPNIDALAARGTKFANAFSQHSVCSPSRASIMTGWYPHVAGHRTLTHLVKPHEPNMLKMMKEAILRWLVETSNVIPWEQDSRFQEKVLCRL